MTVTATASRVTYAGNGTTRTFPVPFYFLQNADLIVIRRTAPNIETTLRLTTDYSVTGAGNAAGGSVTLITAPNTNQSVIIFRDPEVTQTTDYQANDPFPAETHERALDKLTMIAQRVRELVNRSFRLSDGYTGPATTIIPEPKGGNVIGWNTAGTQLQNYDPNIVAPQITYGTTRADIFTGDGVETQFALTSDPGALANLDVSVGGVTQLPTTNYTYSGTTLTFVTPPPNGVPILVRYAQALAQGTMDSSAVSFIQTGIGAVARNARDKMREAVNVLDFGADPTGTVNSHVAFNNAINSVEANGGTVYVPSGEYLIGGTINLKSNVRLIGFGLPKLTRNADNFNIIRVGDSNLRGYNNTVIDGFFIDGKRDLYATGSNINMRGARNVVSNCKLHNAAVHGILLAGHALGAFSVTNNVATCGPFNVPHFKQIGDSVVLQFVKPTPNGTYTVASVIDDYTFTINIVTPDESGDIFLTISDCSENLIIHNEVVNADFVGIGNHTAPDNVIAFNRISGCDAEGITVDCTSYRAKVLNNHLISNAIAGGCGAIGTDNSDFSVFQGNIIEQTGINNNKAGITLNNTANNTDYYTFTGNIFINCSEGAIHLKHAPTIAGESGYWTSSYNTITGNVFYNCNYAVKIDADCKYNNVTGNSGNTVIHIDSGEFNNVENIKEYKLAKLIRGSDFLSPTKSSANGEIIPENQNHGKSFSAASVGNFTWVNNINAGQYVFAKSRSATIGSYSIVQDNDFLGGIVFAGDTGDATNKFNASTAIVSKVKGTPTSTNVPGQIIFRTNNGSGIADRFSLDASGNFLGVSNGGIGYGTGSGGTVTQLTNRTTGVTLNKINGSIVLVSATSSVGDESFVLTNSLISETDVVVVSVKDGGAQNGVYEASVVSVAAGSCTINVRTITQPTTGNESPVINFAVIKAVTS